MKKVFLFFIAITGLLSLSACTSQEFIDTYYQNAETALSEYRFSDAVVEYKKSINLNPQHTESYINAADILINKMKYDEALEILENGENFADEQDRLYAKIGEVYFFKQEYDRAADYYSKALRMNYQNQEAVLGKAETLARSENFDELQSFINSRGTTTDSFEVEVVKGFSFADDYEKSLDFLNNAKLVGTTEESASLDSIVNRLNDVIESDDNEVNKNMLIAREIINYGKPAFALNLVSPIISENEFYEGGYLFKGIVYIFLEKYVESEELLLKSVTYNSQLSEGYRFLAVAQMRQEKYADAGINFTLAFQYGDANDENLLSDYYTYLSETSNTEEAIKTLQTLIGLDSEKKEEYQYNLAEVYCLADGFADELDTVLGEIDKVEADSVIELAQDDTYRACIAYKRESYDEAEQKIVDALSDYKGLPQTYFVQMQISLAKGDTTKASEYKNKVLDVDLVGKYTQLISDYE
jgi:tetratricopeptide (TPR) repeat protein